jgi:hypothetical protein
MGYSQMGHLVLSWTKQNDMFGQDDQWFFSQIRHLILMNKPNYLIIT